MEVQVEGVAKALHEGDGAALASRDVPLPAGAASQRNEDRADEDAEHGARETGVVGEPVAQREGKREHPLSDGHAGQRSVRRVRGGSAMR